MFRHILIPTDGSKLAAKGIKAGVKLAKELGAKVTGVCVVLPYVPPVYGEAAIYYAALGRHPEGRTLAQGDAIVMASHGRGGVGGLLLGSETQRVLAHSKIPVLVIR